MTRQELLALIADEMGHEPGALSLEASIVEDLHWDSLDIIEVVILVEDALGIDIPDEDMERVTTLADLFALPLVAAELEG
jgi:acyl carrier protein